MNNQVDTVYADTFYFHTEKGMCEISKSDIDFLARVKSQDLGGGFL